MKRYIKSSTTESLSGNKFWDNSSLEHSEDLRREFVQGLRKYWENSPYRLQGRNEKSNSIQYLGLFGTGEGLRFKVDTFPLKKNYSLKQLILDYAQDNSIPVELSVDGNFIDVFANKYALANAEESARGHGYDVERIQRAQQETFGETSARNYRIKVHVGNFRKERTGKYVLEAQNILEPFEIEDIEAAFPQIADSITDFQKNIEMDGNKWNEGNAEFDIFTDRELTKAEEAELVSYFEDLLSSIPQDCYYVDIFKHLAY